MAGRERGYGPGLARPNTRGLRPAALLGTALWGAARSVLLALAILFFGTATWDRWRAFPGYPAQGPIRRRRVAVIIPAHNEEQVIAATLASVVAVLDPIDVFVVADGCTDGTAAVARRALPEHNVVEHTKNVGKSRAIEQALVSEVFPRGYGFVTVIDADSLIEPAFISESMRALEDPDVACAVGQVKTLSYAHSPMGVYRTYLYFVWQAIFKRLQSLCRAMTIASGTSTVWRTSVLRQLTFDHRMSTEDFNLTFQVHRRRLGRITYVPSAVVWSQDPSTFGAFGRQGYRWSRAWWESVRRYRVGWQWIRFSRGLPVGVSLFDILAALMVVAIYGFWLRLISLPFLYLYPVDLGPGLLFPSTRETALVLIAWHYGILLVPFVLFSFVLRKFRIAAFLPAMIFLAAADFVISLSALCSTIRHQYRAPAKGHSEASVWASPERHEVTSLPQPSRVSR